MAKKKNPARQEWKPNWLVRVLHFLLVTAASLVKLALGGVATVLLTLVVCAFVLVGAAGDYLQEDVIPEVSFDLDSYSLDQTSFIYFVDEAGRIQQMQKVFTDTDRQWASYDEIPEDLVNAAVAIEDKRFYEHQGVDWVTTIKACARMFFGDDSKGGSTITQQLIKNITQEDSITVQRKVQEIFRALKFESQYDKDVVMEWYLNTIYLGKGCYGVKSAARRYFGKELAELTTAECASLVSITNNPSLFDPYIRPEKNRDRQETVLYVMREEGWITQEEYDEAMAQEMVFRKMDEEETPIYTCLGTAEEPCEFVGELGSLSYVEGLYYCPYCGAEIDVQIDQSAAVYSWFTELVLDDVAKALCEKMGMTWNDTNKELCLNMIKKGGYHIYSTIDMRIQNIVDEVYMNLSNVPTTKSKQQLLSAIVIIDNATGDVVAVSGSVGPKTSFDAFSYATDGGLQTGSVMKPLTVYAPAFELGVINPASVIPDAPLYGNFPRNESRSYGGTASVLTGVMKSLNTTAVHVLDKIGFEYSFDFGKNKFGLEGLLESETTSSGKVLSDMGYSPLGLGGLTYGVTVRDMASAYATFPNDGVYREDRTFTKVYDSEGNLVIDNTQDSEQILSDKAVTYMNYCLRSVVTGGTGTRAALNTTAVAGKTGTTSDNRDRWFIGYTKYYTAAVWCGYENPEQVILTGNSTNPALRMWRQVMERVHEGVKWKDIYDSTGMSYVTICSDSGKLATEACQTDPRGSRAMSAMIFKGESVGGECDQHVTVKWCSEGEAVANDYCAKSGATVVDAGVLKKDQEKKCTAHSASTVETQPPATEPPATQPPATEIPPAG